MLIFQFCSCHQKHNCRWCRCTSLQVILFLHFHLSGLPLLISWTLLPHLLFLSFPFLSSPLLSFSFLSSLPPSPLDPNLIDVVECPSGCCSPWKSYWWWFRSFSQLRLESQCERYPPTPPPPRYPRLLIHQMRLSIMGIFLVESPPVCSSQTTSPLISVHQRPCPSTLMTQHSLLMSWWRRGYSIASSILLTKPVDVLWRRWWFFPLLSLFLLLHPLTHQEIASTPKQGVIETLNIMRQAYWYHPHCYRTLSPSSPPYPEHCRYFHHRLSSLSLILLNRNHSVWRSVWLMAEHSANVPRWKKEAPSALSVPPPLLLPLPSPPHRALRSQFMCPLWCPFHLGQIERPMLESSL